MNRLDRVPVVLACGLLLAQVSLPWTARHFVTQDGPSHVYGASVTWDLLTNRHSRYQSFYQLQFLSAPDWVGPILLRGCISLVGIEHAEQLMATFLVCANFLAFVFACRAFDGSAAWSPVAASLTQTYFFPRGYYDFELGIALCVLVIACGSMRLTQPARSTPLLLPVLSTVLYFTHLLPFFVALVTLSIIALWSGLDHDLPPGSAFSRIGSVLLQFSPGILLAMVYVMRSIGSGFDASRWFEWRRFPVWLGWFSAGVAGHQSYLYSLLALLCILSIATMRSTDWHGLRGGLAVSALLMALLALILPDHAFGGEEIRARLLWAALILAGVLSASIRVPRFLSVALLSSITILTTAGLIRAGEVNRRASVFADAYLAAIDGISPGSTIMRLFFPVPESAQRFHVSQDLLFVPLLHIDSWAAARSGSVLLTDYRAIARTFPIVFRDSFSREQQRALQLLDAAEMVQPEDFQKLIASLPVPVDYFIVVGDKVSTNATQFIPIIQSLGKKEVAGGKESAFVRVFR